MERRLLPVLVAFATVCGGLPSRAHASRFSELAASTVAFASDGARFAAWQVSKDAPVVVLNTANGRRRRLSAPAGCRLHDEAEDGEPIISAAAGRFLLDCNSGTQALLDVQSGKSVFLPNGLGGPSNWYRVGTRYVMGVDTIYDIATGAAARLKRPADLDAPGASLKAVCPAVRRLVNHNPWQGLHLAYAFQGELFAQGFGHHGDVQVDRCQGSPTVLDARAGGAFGHGEPEDFDLRAGVLSWDTGSDAGDYIPSEQQFPGRLYTYRLATHRRQEWRLPRATVTGGGEPVKGTFGYSTHTANTVFWIATRTLGQDEISFVETSAIYATRL